MKRLPRRALSALQHCSAYRAVGHRAARAHVRITRESAEMAGDPTESQHATFIARWDRCEVGRVTLVQQPAGFPSEIPFGLFALYVRPAARGCGIGTLLCRSLLADASVGGPVTVGLLVDADNATAITLYTRLGFIAIGNSIDPTNWPLEYDASGRHLLLMVHRGDSTA